jgi:hypothetical protein
MGLVKRIEQVPPEDPLRNDHCLELGGCTTGWFGSIHRISQTRRTWCVLDLHHIFRNSKHVFWGSYWRDANDCEAEV